MVFSTVFWSRVKLWFRFLEAFRPLGGAYVSLFVMSFVSALTCSFRSCVQTTLSTSLFLSARSHARMPFVDHCRLCRRCLPWTPARLSETNRRRRRWRRRKDPRSRSVATFSVCRFALLVCLLLNFDAMPVAHVGTSIVSCPVVWPPLRGTVPYFSRRDAELRLCSKYWACVLPQCQ